MQQLLSPSSSVTILGAGLLGSLLATSLARQGHRVQVFEAGGPDGVGSAAYVAAAMVAPLAESVVAEASIVRMGQHALARWPELIAPLPAPVYFQREGTLIVWHRQDASDAARLRALFERTQSQVRDLPTMQPLDAAGVAAADPALAGRFAQGLLLPGEGQLDNRQLFAALTLAMQQLGIEVHYDSPREVADFSPGEPGQCDWLIDCRGLGAHTQWREVRGVRGEVVRIHAPEVTLARPTRLIHPRYSIYVAPKEEHVFVIGATEIESDDRSGMSVRSALELLSAAYTIHSGFAEGRILELNTHCRPTLPDNLPAIRITQPRVMEINGMYRHGFMQAPALHDVALQLLNQGQSSLATEFDLALQGPAFA
ncbi:NAD(P)/FAD-dependent oxidoreductase [Alicycliphilus denitrificans]|uniref:NAD(P)/FAD-dependent oxidoreductase n=1 Tax=Alicycliphilus denitrificans TaxID=179636 RepID=UPI00385029B1